MSQEQPRADPQRTTCSRCLERGHRLCHKEQPRADPQRTTCSRCSERGHRLCHKNSRGLTHSGQRAPGAWREAIACITRNSRGLTHSGQRAPGAQREAIASLHIQTTSDAESAGRRVTSVVIQSVMLSPCGGHKAVWDNEETPRSQMPWIPRPPTHRAPVPGNPGPPTPRPPAQGNPRPPGRQRQGTPVPARDVRQRGFQWEDPLPAIDDTPSEQPSQKATASQLSVTKKTKVSGKKQAQDSKKEKNGTCE